MSFPEFYNNTIQRLRSALLALADENAGGRRQAVRSVFSHIDENSSGIVTLHELKLFLLSPEMDCAEIVREDVERVSSMLLEQIDANHDGNVSLSELEEFLFPEASDSDAHESGVVLNATRQTLVALLSSVAASGSDEAVLHEFAALSKISFRKGSQIESRVARKALRNLFIPPFRRPLLDEEVESVLQRLDNNGDGVLSAREFKRWLFLDSENNDKAHLKALLQSLIDSQFNGDIQAFFDRLKGSDQEIFKADFPMSLQSLCNSISRTESRDLCNVLFTNDEKTLSLSRLMDFLDITSLLPAAPDEHATLAEDASEHEEKDIAAHRIEEEVEEAHNNVNEEVELPQVLAPEDHLPHPEPSPQPHDHRDEYEENSHHARAEMTLTPNDSRENLTPFPEEAGENNTHAEDSIGDNMEYAHIDEKEDRQTNTSAADTVGAVSLQEDSPVAEKTNPLAQEMRSLFIDTDEATITEHARKPLLCDDSFGFASPSPVPESPLFSPAPPPPPPLRVPVPMPIPRSMPQPMPAPVAVTFDVTEPSSVEDPREAGPVASSSVLTKNDIPAVQLTTATGATTEKDPAVSAEELANVRELLSLSRSLSRSLASPISSSGNTNGRSSLRADTHKRREKERVLGGSNSTANKEKLFTKKEETFVSSCLSSPAKLTTATIKPRPHTGYWQGFPYNCWSCCETDAVYCTRRNYNNTADKDFSVRSLSKSTTVTSKGIANSKQNTKREEDRYRVFAVKVPISPQARYEHRCDEDDVLQQSVTEDEMKNRHDKQEVSDTEDIEEKKDQGVKLHISVSETVIPSHRNKLSENSENAPELRVHRLALSTRPAKHTERVHVTPKPPIRDSKKGTYKDMRKQKESPLPDVVQGYFTEMQNTWKTLTGDTEKTEKKRERESAEIDALKKELDRIRKEKEEQEKVMREILGSHSKEMQKLRQMVLQRDKLAKEKNEKEKAREQGRVKTIIPFFDGGTNTREREPQRSHSLPSSTTRRASWMPSHHNPPSHRARSASPAFSRSVRQQEMRRERTTSPTVLHSDSRVKLRVPWIPSATQSNAKFNRANVVAGIVDKTKSKEKEKRPSSSPQKQREEEREEALERRRERERSRGPPWVPNANNANASFNRVNARSARSQSRTRYRQSLSRSQMHSNSESISPLRARSRSRTHSPAHPSFSLSPSISHARDLDKSKVIVEDDSSFSFSPSFLAQSSLIAGITGKEDVLSSSKKFDDSKFDSDNLLAHYSAKTASVPSRYHGNNDPSILKTREQKNLRDTSWHSEESYNKSRNSSVGGTSLVRSPGKADSIFFRSPFKTESSFDNVAMGKNQIDILPATNTTRSGSSSSSSRRKQSSRDVATTLPNYSKAFEVEELDDTDFYSREEAELQRRLQTIFRSSEKKGDNQVQLPKPIIPAQRQEKAKEEEPIEKEILLSPSNTIMQSNFVAKELRNELDDGAKWWQKIMEEKEKRAQPAAASQ